MRTFVVVAVLVALGVLFAVQQRTATKQTAEAQPPATRSVSEHDWAKHALDTTAKVRRDVARQRAENTP